MCKVVCAGAAFSNDSSIASPNRAENRRREMRRGTKAQRVAAAQREPLDLDKGVEISIPANDCAPGERVNQRFRDGAKVAILRVWLRACADSGKALPSHMLDEGDVCAQVVSPPENIELAEHQQLVQTKSSHDDDGEFSGTACIVSRQWLITYEDTSPVSMSLYVNHKTH